MAGQLHDELARAQQLHDELVQDLKVAVTVQALQQEIHEVQHGLDHEVKAEIWEGHHLQQPVQPVHPSPLGVSVDNAGGDR